MSSFLADAAFEGQHEALGPVVTGSEGKLFAYQAVPSTQGGALPMVWSDTANVPRPTKFMVPTVVNGHVYVAGGNPNKTCVAGACAGRVEAWQ